jgi:hypothetical protein
LLSLHESNNRGRSKPSPTCLDLAAQTCLEDSRSHKERKANISARSLSRRRCGKGWLHEIGAGRLRHFRDAVAPQEINGPPSAERRIDLRHGKRSFGLAPKAAAKNGDSTPPKADTTKANLSDIGLWEANSDEAGSRLTTSVSNAVIRYASVAIRSRAYVGAQCAALARVGHSA